VQRKDGAPPDNRDKALIETLIRGGQKDENGLTNAVFYSRHPEIAGQALSKGTPLAAEWLLIRNDIVRPALSSPASAKNAPATNAPASATHAAEPGIVEQGIEAVSSVVQAAYHMVVSWFTHDGEEMKSPPTNASGNQPPGAAQGSTYHNQRNNEFRADAGVGEKTSGGDVNAENECNVTTLAMQLQTLAGSEQRLRTAACDLLEQTYKQKLRPADRETTQVEDLILRRFFIPEWADGTKWKEASQAGKKPFYKGWYEDPNQSGTVNTKKFHEHSFCLAYVGMEFSSFIKEVGAIEHAEGDVYSAKYYKEKLKPVLQAGGSVMLGTKLTGKGHVVLLVAVDDDGIVINDPYGLALGKGQYLMNNGETKAARNVFKAFPDAPNVLARRAKVNAAHLTELDQAGNTLPDNMGERVYFNWAEVTQFEIGKWNNAASKVTP